MNDQDAVTYMTEYIKGLEQEALRNKLILGAQSRSNIVSTILNELEKVVANENQQD